MFDSKIETITEVKWDGEDSVEIHTNCSVWIDAKRKDFWHPDSDWESKIRAGRRIRYWTVQYSIVVGFEVELDGEWIAVWCKANDFETKAKRKTSSDAYINFTVDEGVKIAKAIDDGKTLSQIDELISDDHSGNTYGWALNYGIGHAKDKKQAEIIRKQHNLKYDVKEGKGVVNPAILTIR